MIEALVVNKLLRWAHWRLKGGVALSFPSQVSFVRLAPSATHFHDPGVDAECALTHQAFEAIQAISQMVLLVEFISSARTLEEKAALFGRSRRVYKECLSEAYDKIGKEIEQIELLYEKRREVA